jgi:hypothetical protein
MLGQRDTRAVRVVRAVRTVRAVRLLDLERLYSCRGAVVVRRCTAVVI